MNNIEKNDLVKYLKKVDLSFPIPLSRKVNLEEYADKLLEKATLCCEYKEHELVGLVAGYTDNLINNLAYIALVGVTENAQHQGIASRLVKEFCEICNKKKIDKVHLYTDTTNIKAIKMYKKLGFEEFFIENESRPQDIHFILNIQK